MYIFVFNNESKKPKQMNTATNIEMGLTAKEVKLIALEAKGVDPYAPNMMEDFSNRAERLIRKANGQPSYVVRRCYYIVNGVKLA